MRLPLATLVVLLVLGATAPARASSPMPWCGTSPSAADRLPDATQAFAVHVVYARTPGEPDRFAEWAPRIVGDVAAMDAWWRREDPSRTLRFDLFPAVGCSSAFGALDITSVELRQPVGGIDTAFQSLRAQLALDLGLNEPEKSYLVYLDGPTGQSGNDRVCGQGGPGGFGGVPHLAVVFLDSCTSSTGNALRPVVAVHELVHVFGAVSRAAPHHCQDGHVCDAPKDLLAASLTGDELDALLLDPGRDDYYAHPGSWEDVRDSFFLEPLDSPDRAAPSTPGGLRVGDDPSGLTRFSWLRSTDDVGPVAYRIYQDGRFLRQLTATSVRPSATAGGITEYAVRAVDSVGRLSAPASVRFREGVGMVDASGRLVRDTVRPPAIGRVAVRKTATAVSLSWPGVRDAGGIRGYRIRIGTRTLAVIRPAVSIARSRLRAPVSIAAVDRAGNVGPATVVPLSRLR